jgi:tetratricopeptide (TPR) repeat protein
VKRLGAALPKPAGQPQLIAGLHFLAGTRLGAFSLRCHSAVHRRTYERWLRSREASSPRPEALALRGRVLWLLGRREEALRRFEAALAADPACAPALAWGWEVRRTGRGLDEAVASEPGNGWWRLMRGAQALAEGRADDAAADAAAAARDRASSPWGWALMGGVRLRQSKAKEASRALSRAARLSPNTEWLYRLRARAKSAMGEHGSAARDLDRLMSREEAANDLALIARELPESHWALVFEATRSTTGGELGHGAALSALEQAVRKAPRCGWAWAYLARVRGLSKQPGASAALDRAVELSKDCFWILGWRAETRRLAGDLAGAVEDADRAIVLEPYDPMAYVTRGAARRGLGKLRRAEADLLAGIEMEPERSWFYHELMHLRRTQGRIADALEALAEANRLDAKYVWVREASALPEAVSELDRVLQVHPRHPEAHAWRGEARWRLGDLRGALSDLRRAVELGSRQPRLRLWQGRVARDLGRTEEALLGFESAARLEPEDPEAYEDWARMLAELGRVPEARDVLESAVARARASARIRLLKGQFDHRLGRLDAARAEFELVLASAPAGSEHGFEALLRRAEVLLQMGDAAAARLDLEQAAVSRPADPRLETLRASIQSCLAQPHQKRVAPD